MDLFHILIIFPLKILDVTNGVLYHLYVSLRYIWMVLTQVFTELLLVLKPQWKGPELPFVSLLNSSVTRSLWIVEKTYSVKHEPDSFSFGLLNGSLSSFVKDCKFTCWNAP